MMEKRGLSCFNLGYLVNIVVAKEEWQIKMIFQHHQPNPLGSANSFLSFLVSAAAAVRNPNKKKAKLTPNLFDNIKKIINYIKLYFHPIILWALLKEKKNGEKQRRKKLSEASN